MRTRDGMTNIRKLKHIIIITKKNQKNKALYCINYFVTIIQNSVLKRFVFKHLGFFLMKDYMRSFLERLEKMTKTSHKHIDQSHVYTYYCFLQIPSSSSVMTCKFLWLLQTWGNLLSNQFHMYSVRFEKAFHWLAFDCIESCLCSSRYTVTALGTLNTFMSQCIINLAPSFLSGDLKYFLSGGLKHQPNRRSEYSAAT